MKISCKLLVALTLSFSLFFLPIFAYQTYDIALGGYVNSFYLTTSQPQRSLSFRLVNTSNVTVYNETLSLNTEDFTYQASNDFVSDISYIYLGTAAQNFDLILAPDLYDYYIYITVHGHELFSFSPNRVRLRTYDNSENATLWNLDDLSVYYHNDTTKYGFTVCGKIPDGFTNTNLSVIDIFSNGGSLSSDLTLEGVVFAFEKSAQVTSNNIISAIDNQTQTIINGTESSSNSADLAESINLDLKDVIDEYDSIEQSYIQDFNTNLGNIDLSGFSWDSSFLTSASWVTTQFNNLVMETPFENLITFSLIIGITLYLIGRYKG